MKLAQGLRRGNVNDPVIGAAGLDQDRDCAFGLPVLQIVGTENLREAVFDVAFLADDQFLAVCVPVLVRGRDLNGGDELVPAQLAIALLVGRLGGEGQHNQR